MTWRVLQEIVSASARLERRVYVWSAALLKAKSEAGMLVCASVFGPVGVLLGLGPDGMCPALFLSKWPASKDRFTPEVSRKRGFWVQPRHSWPPKNNSFHPRCCRCRPTAPPRAPRESRPLFDLISIAFRSEAVRRHARALAWSNRLSIWRLPLIAKSLYFKQRLPPPHARFLLKT